MSAAPNECILRHGISLMLNELEFAYAPVREKVRDLREYL